MKIVFLLLCAGLILTTEAFLLFPSASRSYRYCPCSSSSSDNNQQQDVNADQELGKRRRIVNNSDKYDRSNALGVLTSVISVLGTIFGRPQVSRAWCGKAYPSWAYRMRFNDGVIPINLNDKEDKQLDLFIRVVGDESKEKKNGLIPMIVIPGGPGLPHDYLETLEALAYEDRRIITFDPLGTGQSSRSAVLDANLEQWSQAIAKQLEALVEFLEIKDHHIYAHGFGVLPALAYIAQKHNRNKTESSIVSLTLASPFLMTRKESLSKAYQEAQEQVPLCVSETIQGSISSEEGGESKQQQPPLQKQYFSSLLSADLGDPPVFITSGSSKDDLSEKDINELKKSLAKLSSTEEEEKERIVVSKVFPSLTPFPHIDNVEMYCDWLDEQLKIAELRVKQMRN